MLLASIRLTLKQTLFPVDSEEINIFAFSILTFYITAQSEAKMQVVDALRHSKRAKCENARTKPKKQMKKSITSYAAVLLLIAAGLLPTFSYAQPGSLDLSFDNDGIVTTAFGNNTDQGYSVAIQSDGKIVVAGYSYNGSDYDFALVRYNADGSLDNSFDSDGKITTAIGNGDDLGFSVGIQSDGRIVVAGKSSNGSNDDFALVRYNTDGSLDNSFDSDGKVTTAIGSGDDKGSSVAKQSDGKIMVAGLTYNGSDFDFALVRYNIDGSLDNTFDSDGKVTTAIGSGDDMGLSVAKQNDGKIVAAGYSNNGSNNDFALVRYNGSATSTGITSLSANQSISIFPNPSNGIFTIQCADKILDLEIINAFGEKCITTTVNSQQETVNLSSQPNGIYFLQLKTDQGVLNKKIVLQK
jgi:uncharacterized delta-60 repeat protein